MLERLLPPVTWLRTYNREDLRGDLVAGVTVGMMLVPQAMAYAMLAGLDPVVGLYAATLPLLAYALLGSSRHLAVGPVAMVSLLVMTGCSALAEPRTAEYAGLALLLALMVGVGQLAMGLLRMGFLVNFLSHAVTSGFTSAAAIIICLSQVKHVLGIDLEGGENAIGRLIEALSRLGETHLPTAILGGVGIAVLVALRKVAPRVPAPLVVVAAGTLLVYLLRLDESGIATVGDVPRGLPAFSLPSVTGESLAKLGPTALVIIFVGYMESIAVAQVIAARERQRIDPNQELRGLGLANILAGLFSGYPVTGGFSRTAVNHQAGAKTGLAGVVTAGIVALTLLLLTPLFVYLPNAVLAAIIIVAVVGLIDVRGARELFRIKSVDGVTLAITFVSTLALGIETGILVGVGFSLLVFVWQSAHPHTAELGYVAEEGIFRDLSRYPEAQTYPRALILRVDASLYFANMRFVEECIRRALAEREDIEWVVMQMSGVNDIDASAVHGLSELMQSHREHGIRFACVGMKAHVRDIVERAGWGADEAGPRRFRSLEHALQELGLAEDDGP